MQNNIGLCSDDLNQDALAFQGWLHEEAAKKLFAVSGVDFNQVTEAAKKPGFKSFALKAKSKVIMTVQLKVCESHNVAGLLPGTALKLSVIHILRSLLTG